VKSENDLDLGAFATSPLTVSLRALLIDSSNYRIIYSRINAVTIPVRLVAIRAISPPKNYASKLAQDKEI